MASGQQGGNWCICGSALTANLMWHKHTRLTQAQALHNEIFICSSDFEVTYTYTTWLALFHLLRSITYPTQGCKLPCQYCARSPIHQGGVVAMEFLSRSRKMRLLIYCFVHAEIFTIYVYCFRPCSFAAHLHVQQKGGQLSWIRRSLDSVAALRRRAWCKNGWIRFRIVANKQRFGTQT